MSADASFLDPDALPVTPAELRRALALLLPAAHVDEVVHELCDAFAQQEHDRFAAEAAIAAGERDPFRVNYCQVGVGVEVLVACSLLGDDVHARLLVSSIPRPRRPAAPVSLSEAERLVQAENPDWWAYWTVQRPAIAAALAAGEPWEPED